MPCIAGRKYEMVVASDVGEREGMSLELYDGDRQIIEVFYSDSDGAMTLSAYQENLPLAVVEWAIAEGRSRLPPKT